MKKRYVPYEKLSKKDKREKDAMGRVTWGEMSPVTRMSRNPGIYDRNREKRRWMNIPHGDETSGGCFV